MVVKTRREVNSRYRISLPYRNEISVENMIMGIVTKTNPAKNVMIVVID